MQCLECRVVQKRRPCIAAELHRCYMALSRPENVATAQRGMLEAMNIASQVLRGCGCDEVGVGRLGYRAVHK